MTRIDAPVRVAIYDQFLDALMRIPRAQQRKVHKFVRKFRRDPTSSSINYEKISTFADPNLRTVRIDLAWRAVVLHPAEGNLYVLLWVDHHDEAMRWAERKRIEVHPETGALQVLTGVEVEVPGAGGAAGGSVEEDLADGAEGGLYDHVRDRELRRLGVPDVLLPEVRRVARVIQLEDLQERLPEEAFEALWFLGEGESLAEVERAMASSPPGEPVDTEDFEAALERPDSQRRFVVVDDDATLSAMLDAPMEKWRVFLHPSQRRLIERHWNGPVRVLGGAGTGKTVVALHRAAWLVRNVLSDPDQRVLFTTFTANLAADIRDNLRRLLTPREREQVEVVHLDEWVRGLLEQAGYRYRIGYADQPHMKGLWEQALSLRPPELDYPAAFYREEWEQVVQDQGCATWQDYKVASRAGRGRRMSRGQRRAAWPVFQQYRNLLEEHRLREPEGAMRDVIQLLQAGQVRVPFRAALVDEAQDMTTTAFQLLRAAIPEGEDDLFIVGDGHQRIYRRRVVLSHAGVRIVGRSHRLRINYRTTDEIRRRAVALLEGLEVDDLDGGADSLRGYRSLVQGVEPRFCGFEHFEDEVAKLMQWLRAAEDLRNICVVARTVEQRDRYRQGLEAAGVETRLIRRGKADDPREAGVRLATMHRVKGLEFDRVALVGLDSATLPLAAALAQADDEERRADLEKMERALLYVAMTRARSEVRMSWTGRPSRYLGRAAR